MTGPGDATDSLFGLMDALVAPFRALVSKQAQKAYLGTLFFIITAICMSFVSTVAYWIFYYNFIPQVGLERNVHLQFGDGHPWGLASLGPELVSLQPYDVSVVLELPRTPSNLATGNFMLDLSLFSHPSTSALTGTNTSTARISQSRRPAILTYASSMVDTATTLSFMPLYVLGWQRESETLMVPMFEQVEFPRGWRNLPASLRLEIHSHEKIQIYNAKVEFRARFTGLRWAMYNWRASSFFVFSFMFWSISMVATSVTWLILVSLFSSGEEEQPKIKQEGRNQTLIKEESDDEQGDASSLETSSDTSKDGSGRIKREEEEPEWETKYEVPGSQEDDESDESGDQEAGPSEHSGLGTGRESPEARGIQRRRSHLFTDERS